MAADGSRVQNVMIQNLSLGGLSARTAFDLTVRQPLEQLCTPDFDDPIVILVDALDEARTWRQEDTILSLLGQTLDDPHDLPPQVRLVLATRPDERVLQTIGLEPSLDLLADAPPDAGEVKQYASVRLERASINAKLGAELAGRLAAASEGNFLYARYILDDWLVRSSELSLSAALDLPAGLSGIYREFLKREAEELLAEFVWKVWQQKDRTALSDHVVKYGPNHLAEAGQLGFGPKGDEYRCRLAAMLIDYNWLRAKLERTDVTSLLADFERLAELPEALSLLYEALYLFAHVLARDPAQLPSQLYGRLLDRPEQDIRVLLEKAKDTTDFPWLGPLARTLEAPGGPLVRNFNEHTRKVNAVALTPDGRFAVSGSEDNTLKVWELETGREMRTLEGHINWVSAVAVTPDGRFAVSGSRANTLKVWELETSRLLATFSGEGAIACCAISPDNQLLVTGDASGRVHFLSMEGLDVNRLGAAGSR